MGGGLSDLFEEEEKEFGPSWYRRVDVPADLKVREAIKALRPEDVSCAFIGSEPVARVTDKTREGIKFGGIKVETLKSWFVVRPSGTEAIYKIYAESFSSPEQLQSALDAAKALVKGLCQD